MDVDLQLVPFLVGDVSLPKDAREQPNSDYSLVGIGEDELATAAKHKWMGTADKRTLEPEMA